MCVFPASRNKYRLDAWWENPLCCGVFQRRKKGITRERRSGENGDRMIKRGQQKYSYERKRRFKNRGQLSVSSPCVLMSPPAAPLCWDSTQRWSQGFSRPPTSLIPLVWRFFRRIASDFSPSLWLCSLLSGLMRISEEVRSWSAGQTGWRPCCAPPPKSSVAVLYNSDVTDDVSDTQDSHVFVCFSSFFLCLFQMDTISGRRRPRWTETPPRLWVDHIMSPSGLRFWLGSTIVNSEQNRKWAEL